MWSPGLGAGIRCQLQAVLIEVQQAAGQLPGGYTEGDIRSEKDAYSLLDLAQLLSDDYQFWLDEIPLEATRLPLRQRLIEVLDKCNKKGRPECTE